MKVFTDFILKRDKVKEVVYVWGNRNLCVHTKEYGSCDRLTKASVKAEKKVVIFFTGEGVNLTQDPKFSELLKDANSRIILWRRLYRGPYLQRGS